MRDRPRRIEDSELRQRLVRGALAAALLFATAGPARALTIAPNPIPFDVGGALLGSVELIDVVAGVPVGGAVLEGSVAAGDLTLVFRLTMDAASDPIGPVGVFVVDPDTATLVDPTGGGTIAGGDVDIAAVVRLTVSGVGDSLDFVPAGGPFSGGDVSDVFFASFPDVVPGLGVGVLVGAPPEPGPPFGARFAFHATVVPEPGSAGLLAVGLGALAAARRAKRIHPTNAGTPA